MLDWVVTGLNYICTDFCLTVQSAVGVMKRVRSDIGENRCWPHMVYRCECRACIGLTSIVAFLPPFHRWEKLRWEKQTNFKVTWLSTIFIFNIYTSNKLLAWGLISLVPREGGLGSCRSPGSWPRSCLGLCVQCWGPDQAGTHFQSFSKVHTPFY